MTSGGVTAAQLRAARALLKIEQQDLCGRAKVSIATLRRMEGGEGPVKSSYENVRAVQEALEAAGVEFIPENGGGAGVRLRKALSDHPKPTGPATDAVDKMDAAIEGHRSRKKQ